jgi:hypothetical protein
MKNKDDIEKFICYFEEEIKKVSRVKNHLYKKILFACMLDALGTARFPKHNTDERMISFLLNCTKCSDLNRVSLIQANLFLKHVLSAQEKATSQIQKVILQETSRMKGGHLYRGNEIDPYYNQIEKIATLKEKRVLKLARYVDLFYAYRNEMVHGFKKPGYGVEMSNDDSNPYYHGLINEPWQLVFPALFFQNLCKEALNGLWKYLEDNDINPYDQYEFGHMWVKTRKLEKIMTT